MLCYYYDKLLLIIVNIYYIILYCIIIYIYCYYLFIALFKNELLLIYEYMILYTIIYTIITEIMLLIITNCCEYMHHIIKYVDIMCIHITIYY